MFCIHPKTKKPKSVCRSCAKIKARKYYEVNRDRLLTHQKAYAKVNKDKIAARKKSHYHEHRVEIALKTKEKRAANPAPHREQSLRWQRENKEQYLTYLRKYRRDREARDPSFKLGSRLRARIKHALHIGRATKKFPFEKMVGADVATVRQHLESLWLEGMTWENWGIYRVGESMTWHIDHIRPCASFDLTDPEQQKQCFHYTNLQPLWAKDNLTKHAKYSHIKS